MGAVALSRQDEDILNMLKKNLGLPSKSQVIHRALKELEIAVARKHLSSEIARSVQMWTGRYERASCAYGRCLSSE